MGKFIRVEKKKKILSSWLAKNSVVASFPALYALASNKEVKVIEFLGFNNEGGRVQLGVL